MRMYVERKSKVQELHEAKGWPLKISARGYIAYLAEEQQLNDGQSLPVYRFPGGLSLVDECEMVEVQ